MRWRAGVLGGGFAVEEPSRWEASETDLRGGLRVPHFTQEDSELPSTSLNLHQPCELRHVPAPYPPSFPLTIDLREWCLLVILQ